MADVSALRRQQAQLRQLNVVQTALSLVARQKLLLDRRQERVAKTSETMQREARDAAIIRWDKARGERSFDPLLTAAASAVVVRRHADWERAASEAKTAIFQSEKSASHLQRQRQREDISEIMRRQQARRLIGAMDDRDQQLAEDVIAFRFWEQRSA
jgi:hypothetical protein